MEVKNGNLGIAFGISLSIERLLGMGEEPPSKGYVINNSTLSISLGVVVKSILSNIEKANANKIIIRNDVSTMVKLVDSQLETLMSLSSNFKQKGLKVVIHLTNYKHIEDSDTLISKTNTFITKIEKRYSNEFKIYVGSDLLMTNNPFDMLKLPQTSYVINTHTGDLLSKRELSKKLKRGSSYDTTNFPLVQTTLEVFGDSYGYYKGKNISTKRSAAMLLNKSKVSPRFSDFEIRNILKKGKLI